MLTLVTALSIFLAASVRGDSTPCADAERLLRQVQRMTTAIDVDTVDDWRTRRRLAGCRVTAAGSTDVDIGQESARFFVRLRASGWTRTPDPRDAPTESSLRFRRGATDCLFNLYQGALLQTDAEGQVMASHIAASGEQTKYQLLVVCLPALPAAPR